MDFARWSTVLLAALLASPALWHGFVTQSMDHGTALTRYLIAVPVAAVMLALLRGLGNSYLRSLAAQGNQPQPDTSPATVLEPDSVHPSPGRRSTDDTDQPPT